MSTPVLSPSLSTASVLAHDETGILNELAAEVHTQRPKLALRDAYYNGVQIIRDMGISVPPALRKLHTVVGWPRTSVDSLEERLDLQSLRYPADDRGTQYLDSVWQYNRMFKESQLAHLDALIFGFAFIVVGTNEDDRAMPLISVESPVDMACRYDARTRRVTAAVRLHRDEHGREGATLLLPDTTVVLAPDQGQGWTVLARDDHGMGRVPVVRLGNRQRIDDRRGTSEITNEIMSITDSACRTLLGVEVAREFYAAPQRYILGASEGAFQDAEGNAKSAWETYLGRVLAMERDEDGNIPEVGQFTPYSPGVYTEIMDMYGKLMVSQTGLPPQNFGLTYEQPASADAIRMGEQRVIKRAERRQTAFGDDWEDVASLVLLNAFGSVPPEARTIEAVWQNAATPTLAAQADAAMKLVAAGIIPADSDVTREMAGFSPSQRVRLAADLKRAEAKAAREAVVQAALGASQGQQTAPGQTTAPATPGKPGTGAASGSSAANRSAGSPRS